MYDDLGDDSGASTMGREASIRNGVTAVVAQDRGIENALQLTVEAIKTRRSKTQLRRKFRRRRHRNKLQLSQSRAGYPAPQPLGKMKDAAAIIGDADEKGAGPAISRRRHHRDGRGHRSISSDLGDEEEEEARTHVGSRLHQGKWKGKRKGREA